MDKKPIVRELEEALGKPPRHISDPLIPPSQRIPLDPSIVNSPHTEEERRKIKDALFGDRYNTIGGDWSKIGTACPHAAGEPGPPGVPNSDMINVEFTWDQATYDRFMADKSVDPKLRAVVESAAVKPQTGNFTVTYTPQPGDPLYISPDMRNFFHRWAEFLHADPKALGELERALPAKKDVLTAEQVERARQQLIDQNSKRD